MPPEPSSPWDSALANPVKQETAHVPSPCQADWRNPMPGDQGNHLLPISCGHLKPLVSMLLCSVIILPDGLWQLCVFVALPLCHPALVENLLLWKSTFIYCRTWSVWSLLCFVFFGCLWTFELLTWRYGLCCLREDATLSYLPEDKL